MNTDSMILSLGLKGPNEFKAILSIACSKEQTSQKYSLSNKFCQKRENTETQTRRHALTHTHKQQPSHQSDLVSLIDHKETIPLDVVLSRLQQSLERNQTDHLGAHHWQVQGLVRWWLERMVDGVERLSREEGVVSNGCLNRGLMLGMQ